MLRVKKLILKDFGPYKDTQEIDFPTDDGVIVFFGENGRGKTSLLNAIRFAFYDRILGRGSRKIEYEKILNLEAKQEGRTEFSVVLHFDFANKPYELTRVCEIKNGSAKTETYLIVDGAHQNPEATKKILNKIMPEQVSRFFLFDGELLQEYEDLLNESSQSLGIKEAIEKILGVPILKNAITHIDDRLKEAKKQEAKSLQNIQQHNHLGQALKAHQDEEASLEVELRSSERDLANLKNDRMECESLMRQNEKAEKLLVRKQGLQSEIKDLKTEISNFQDNLNQQSPHLWLLPLESLLTDKERTLANDSENALDRFGNAFVINLKKNLLNTSTCPICETNIDSGKKSIIAKSIDGHDVDGTVLLNDVQRLNSRANTLKGIMRNCNSDLIKHLSNQIKNKRIKLKEKEIELKDIDQEIFGVDEKELLGAKNKLEKVNKEISKIENQIENINSQLGVKRQQMSELQRNSAKLGAAGAAKETYRREIYEQLNNIFTKALDQYRDRLKHDVEKAASSLFKSFSSDKDYDRLRINSNYGLTIVHKDGEEIPVRSAGFEHIVALSLMGSLQKNAPLRGPIFMDSPMGRLDKSHKTNLTKGLPTMSGQVALLVYEDEISQDEVTSILGAKLLKKFSLTRISSRHTIIEEK